MYRIAINTAILFFKKEKKQSIYENEYQFIVEKTIENVESDEEKLKILYQTIQHLDKI
jgi:DNA-directed RNA polymerase specialized sigma24 family protein